MSIELLILFLQMFVCIVVGFIGARVMGVRRVLHWMIALTNIEVAERLGIVGHIITERKVPDSVKIGKSTYNLIRMGSVKEQMLPGACGLWLMSKEGNVRLYSRLPDVSEWDYHDLLRLQAHLETIIKSCDVEKEKD